MTGAVHSGRLSLAAKDRTYRLDDDTLHWREEGAEGSVPLSDIAALRLISYAGAGGRQKQATIHTRSGETLKLRSHHYMSLGAFEDRSETYGPFVRTLCERVAQANPQAMFQRGHGGLRTAWAVVLGLCAIVTLIFVAAIASGNLSTEQVAGGGFTCVILTLLAWRAFNNNTPLPFDPAAPPEDML